MYYSSPGYGPPVAGHNHIPVQPGFMTINDANGRATPYVVYSPMTYEQQINYRRQMRQQQMQYVEKQLKENFPKAYVLAHSILLAMICVVEIVLQIVIIANNGSLYYIANGIWGGAFGVVLAAITVSLIKYRHAYFYLASVILHSLGLFIFLLAFVFINAIALGQYTYCPDSVFFYKTCFNLEMRPITIVCMVLGVLAAILCFIYVVFMSFQINGLCNNNNNRRAQAYQPNPNNQAGPIQTSSFNQYNYPVRNQEASFEAPKYNI